MPEISFIKNQAFKLARGEECKTKWKEIPSNTDILLTHIPPIGHGDRCHDKIDARVGYVAGIKILTQSYNTYSKSITNIDFIEAQKTS